MAKTKSRIDKASDIMRYRPKPSLSVDSKDLPAIKDWSVGKTYTFTVKAKMVYVSEGDEYGDYEDEGGGDNKRMRARFRISKITEK